MPLAGRLLLSAVLSYAETRSGSDFLVGGGSSSRGVFSRILSRLVLGVTQNVNSLIYQLFLI